ncbi:hypothetical protein [Merismopedia glauca]|uniref:Uncharacterized protein n=1 Tax=Merismopedia glauca CCAP 1448/3 TaxID=1296344 RepID=A0A2T1C6Z2_9CYAN|nr:hypothetical protein [Merismopedia glauca]PSB03994.1 hypothetical protein C7B64_06000 [Merismopedia glauca CCAP 1448/3]
MYLLAKHRHLTIYCLVTAALIAGLSGGQTTVAATQKVSDIGVTSSIPSDRFDISQERPNSLFKGLSRAVVNAIRQDIAQRTGITPGRVRILRYSRQTWSDGCLGLPRSDEFCTEVLTPGWRVTATADNQTWIYRTDAQGRNVRLDRGNTNNTQLTKAVADAVLADVQNRFQINPNSLKIITAERRSWSDGCLGLADPGQFCTEAIVPGWRVTVAGNSQQWVYRTNSTGSVVKFDRRASSSTNNDTELPKRVADAVLEDAASVLNVSAARLEIIKAEEKIWSGGCLGLPRPREACTRNLVPGWEVTVRGNRQILVYRTNQSGSVVRLDREASDFEDSMNSELPDDLADAVLRETQRRSGLSRSRLKIVAASQKTWSDGCLGLGGIADICAAGRVKGWLVTVEGGNQRWVYHTDSSGSRIVLNPEGSDDNGTITPDQIPQDQLPSPLQRNVVFRAISTGGFTGRTYETVLLEDGRVLRFSGNSSSQEVNRISLSELREFQQLLDEQRFYQFDRLDYKPNRGAADFITVTFTSLSGTTRYADIIQEGLPQPLRRVISAWNEIVDK